MCIGWDSGDAVSELYKTPARFTGGTIQAVAVDSGDDVYVDLELEAKRLLMTH
jgi:arylsulfatase